eukprot:254153_1
MASIHCTEGTYFDVNKKATLASECVPAPRSSGAGVWDQMEGYTCQANQCASLDRWAYQQCADHTCIGPCADSFGDVGATGVVVCHENGGYYDYWG